MAKSFAAVSEVWPSATSARRMVFRPKAASHAKRGRPGFENRPAVRGGTDFVRAASFDFEVIFASRPVGITWLILVEYAF
jgi:hypothetical protein